MTTKSNHILQELTEISPFLAGLEKRNVFFVPEGYFASIPDTVLACLQEEVVITPLQQIKPTQSVPEGYFEHLSVSILEKIKKNEPTEEPVLISEHLTQILQTKVFDTPPGYFDTLPAIILNKVSHSSAGHELMELSSVLQESRRTK